MEITVPLTTVPSILSFCEELLPESQQMILRLGPARSATGSASCHKVFSFAVPHWRGLCSAAIGRSVTGRVGVVDRIGSRREDQAAVLRLTITPSHFRTPRRPLFGRIENDRVLCRHQRAARARSRVITDPAKLPQYARYILSSRSFCNSLHRLSGPGLLDAGGDEDLHAWRPGRPPCRCPAVRARRRPGFAEASLEVQKAVRTRAIAATLDAAWPMPSVAGCRDPGRRRIDRFGCLDRRGSRSSAAASPYRAGAAPWRGRGGRYRER